MPYGKRISKENIEIGEPLLEVKDLKSGQLFEDVTFHVGKGEIVGFAGLVGAGRTEVMRCLFGLDPIDGGTVKVHGKEIKIKRVADATKAGMVMLRRIAAVTALSHEKCARKCEPCSLGKILLWRACP